MPFFYGINFKVSGFGCQAEHQRVRRHTLAVILINNILISEFSLIAADT
jgi:hypothetical protein